MLGQVKDLERWTPSAMSKYLQEVSQTSILYSWLGIVNSQGKILALSRPDVVGTKYQEIASAEIKAPDQAIVVKVATLSEVLHGVMSVKFFVPIERTKGNRKHFLVTEINAHMIEQLLERTVSAFSRLSKKPIWQTLRIVNEYS